MKISEIRRQVPVLRREGKNGYQIAEALRDAGADIDGVMRAMEEVGFVACRGEAANGDALEVSPQIIRNRQERGLAGAHNKLIPVVWPSI